MSGTNTARHGERTRTRHPPGYEFPGRQEVKDAIAYLRFLRNPADGRSFRRILQRPPCSIGNRATSRVPAAEGIGIGLVDTVSPSALKTADPFGKFLRALGQGAITVFDTEMIGHKPDRGIDLNPSRCFDCLRHIPDSWLEDG
ncbi:MAG: hypothetical protein NUW12_04895 [Firmicutes bacterium]|nr:hypothetical protein [Bacillota bacterium]MDH7495285.1 3'-5' exonuclease [Bacillota bacterium]